MRNRGRIGSMKISWLATLGAILVLSATAKPAPSGEVTLSYDAGSKSRVILILQNASAQTIYFRGTKTFKRGTNPWDIAMECTSAKTKLWDEQPFALSDGKWQSIKVSPGQRVRLSVYGFAASFAANHKGDRCILHLELLEHRVIDSEEFRP